MDTNEDFKPYLNMASFKFVRITTVKDSEVVHSILPFISQ